MGLFVEVSAETLVLGTNTDSRNSVPSGLLAAIALFFIMPHYFPDTKSKALLRSDRPGWKKQLARLDVIGALLLLAASIFLVTALTQAGTDLPWSSPEVIVLLALSVVVWIAFGLWSWKLNRVSWPVESIFPWRFVKSRPLMGVLM